MTANLTTRWRKIVATTGILAATMSVATAIAFTAEARIKNGSQDFDACVQDSIKYHRDRGEEVDMDIIQIGCCISIGGVLVQDDQGNFKDCIFNSTTEPDRPVPPTGATILPHPGDNQGPLGPGQPAPPPSAVLPPGLNQTGIQ
jgi:hypothetical protein